MCSRPAPYGAGSGMCCLWVPRPAPYGAGTGMCPSWVQILGGGRGTLDALLDGEGALHARLLVRVNIAEERVVTGLEVLEGEGRGAIGHLIGATELAAPRVVDAHVVGDRRVGVVEVDRHRSGLRLKRVRRVRDRAWIR